MATIANIYTEILGSWAKWLFLPGAFAVLYSSLVTNVAAGSRIYTDGLSRLGLLDFHNVAMRWRWIGILAWTMPLSWIALYLYFRAPGFMILIGGVAGLVVLLIIAFTALNFRYSQKATRAKRSIYYDICLWISCTSIVWIGIYGLINVLR